jgi:GGDEF domain-containing protein
MDLDGLKALNDREGHLAGDALLRRFGACLQALARSHGGGVSASGGTSSP